MVRLIASEAIVYPCPEEQAKMTKAHLEPEADDAREVLGLIVEWYDPQPQLVRQYVLKVGCSCDDPALWICAYAPSRS
jgi:hypothetical protein